MVKQVIYEYFDSRSWTEILHVIKIKKTGTEGVQINHEESKPLLYGFGSNKLHNGPQKID
jgi:hypothetical protein